MVTIADPDDGAASTPRRLRAQRGSGPGRGSPGPAVIRTVRTKPSASAPRVRTLREHSGIVARGKVRTGNGLGDEPAHGESERPGGRAQGLRGAAAGLRGAAI